MTSTLTALPLAAPFVHFNQAELSDVPDYSDKRLMDLIEWAEHECIRLINRERIGSWDLHCALAHTLSELRDLKRAAEAEARGRNLLPSVGGKG